MDFYFGQRKHWINVVEQIKVEFMVCVTSIGCVFVGGIAAL